MMYMIHIKLSTSLTNWFFPCIYMYIRHVPRLLLQPDPSVAFIII